MARADTTGIAHSTVETASEGAASWFVRLRDTALSDRDRADFAAWLAQSPDHAAAMADMANIWHGLDALPNLQQPAAMPVPRMGSVTRRYLLGGMAAAAVAVTWGATRQRDTAAAFGQHQQAAFGTNAALDLDSLSALDIDANEPNPSAALRHGQVFVTTARPAGQSVALHVPFGQVRAHAAVFNLKLERHRALVSVQSGTVQIGRAVGGPLELGPLAELAFGNEVVDEPRQVAPYRIAPWRQGRLIFDRTLLVDAVDDLNRYRPGRVMVGDPRLDDLLVTGNFRTKGCDAALQAILDTFSLKSLHIGDELTVLFSA